MKREKITGRWCIKKGLFSYYVIVESITTYQTLCFNEIEVREKVVWRKAKISDLIALNLPLESSFTEIVAPE